MSHVRCFVAGVLAGPILLMSEVPSRAQENLAEESQNPLSTVISVPFENNTYFGIGPSDATVNVLNVKPVIPFRVGSVNLINRFITPIIYSTGQNARDLFALVPQEVELGFAEVGSSLDVLGSEFGLGDTTYQLFLSPAKPGKVIWGAGPAVVLPTATASRFASKKWSAGPNAVALTISGNWVIGILGQNVWSFAGDSGTADVNKFLLQYFINYNMSNGWYLSTTPIITADWNAASGERWTVPFGGGVGRLVMFGSQPVDFKLAGYWNAEKPTNAPDWNVQFQVKFLFPKK